MNNKVLKERIKLIEGQNYLNVGFEMNSTLSKVLSLNTVIEYDTKSVLGKIYSFQALLDYLRYRVKLQYLRKPYKIEKKINRGYNKVPNFWAIIASAVWKYVDGTAEVKQLLKEVDLKLHVGVYKKIQEKGNPTYLVVDEANDNYAKIITHIIKILQTSKDDAETTKKVNDYIKSLQYTNNLYDGLTDFIVLT